MQLLVYFVNAIAYLFVFSYFNLIWFVLLPAHMYLVPYLFWFLYCMCNSRRHRDRLSTSSTLISPRRSIRSAPLALPHTTSTRYDYLNFFFILTCKFIELRLIIAKFTTIQKSSQKFLKFLLTEISVCDMRVRYRC